MDPKNILTKEEEDNIVQYMMEMMRFSIHDGNDEKKLIKMVQKEASYLGYENSSMVGLK